MEIHLHSEDSNLCGSTEGRSHPAPTTLAGNDSLDERENTISRSWCAECIELLRRRQVLALVTAFPVSPQATEAAHP